MWEKHSDRDRLIQEWVAVMDRDAVLGAIERYDQLGPERVGKIYGFELPRGYAVMHGSRSYPWRALVGIAYEIRNGAPLTPKDCGPLGAGRPLIPLRFVALGFGVRDL
jgi:5-methylcytosine-specific restriction enzyme A